MTLITPPARPTNTFLVTLLPGPDRRRTLSTYGFRVTYRNPEPTDTGCVMTCRLPYQVALERTAAGELQWHCSCADAVYRGEDNPVHVCKHVRGLIDSLPPVAARTAAAAPVTPSAGTSPVAA